MSENLQVIAPALPAGSCVDPQIVQLMGQIQVIFPSEYSLFIKGANEPSVEQRDYAWMKTNAITGVIQGIYTWSGLYGKWLKPHFVGSSIPTNERRIFVGSLTDLETYDGGESGTVTETTGPFWERDTDFNDVFPAGVGGTITTVATNFDVVDTGTTGIDARGVYFIKPSGRVYDRGN